MTDGGNRKSLHDRFLEHMREGDRLAIIAAGQRYAGTIEEVGEDLVALRTLFGRVDVHLSPGIPLWYELFERGATEGTEGNHLADGKFLNALDLHEHDAEVTVGSLTDPDGIDGRIEVGSDHVKVIARAGAETVLPLWTVSWVCPRRQ
jgi:hypothetical protein